MKEEKISFKNKLGQKLVGILRVPEGEGPFPAAIFHHGYKTGKNTKKAKFFGENIPIKNVVFLSFDSAGHDESEGHERKTDQKGISPERVPDRAGSRAGVLRWPTAPG